MGVPIGVILVKKAVATQAMVDEAWREAKARSERICTRLLETGVPEAALASALSEQQSAPGVDLSRCVVDLALLDLVPRGVAEKDQFLPLSDEGGRLHLAMASPNDQRLISEVRFVTGREVSAYVAVDGSLARAIKAAYDARERGETVWRGAAAGPGLPPQLVVATDGEEELEITEAEESPIELDPLGPEDEPILVDDAPVASGSAEEVVLTVRPAGRRTILVVDDEPEIRLLVQRALEKHGYAIETASDGAEGIAKAEAMVPDLVLLDAMLPKVHGFDACRRLKSGGRTRHMPIIMMTAIYRGWRFAQDARDAYGAEDYVEKPFRFEDLLRRIEAVLEATDSRPRADVAAAVAHVAKGKELLAANRLPDARLEFEAAIAADPYSAEAHAQLARTLRANGDGFSAMTAFEKAAELRPTHLGVLRALASLYEEKGFRRKAAETLERALSAAPDDAVRGTIKQDLLKLLG